MKVIEAVIFDVGGVLNLGSRNAQKKVAEHLEISVEEWRNIRRTHRHAFSTGQITEAEFWQGVSQEYQLQPREPQILTVAYEASIEPHLPALQVVACLRQAGMRLAILSNTIPPHAAVLQAQGIFEGFDPVVLSYEARLRKPDPAIFLHTLARLDLQADQTVFIDDAERNVASAQSLGMHAIRFTPELDLAQELRQFAPLSDIL